MATDVRAAYRRCEEITWSQARNFSYGIRLLPPAKRHALAAVYAFARRIDDIGDGTLPAPEKLAALEGARAGLSALMTGGADDSDEVLVALADAAARFDIPLAAFGELIDGCTDDVRGVTYRTFDDLLHYCRCVAGSIGRLSLGVFGTSDPDTAAPLADSLGVALQLTNILRDIREDYASGRVYLPAEDLARFGCALDADPATHPGRGKLTALVAFEADRARSWYATGLTLMPLLDRRSAASAGAMAGIYFRLLEHIAASPAAVLTRRVSLSAREKAGVAVKSLAAAALRPPARRHPRGPGESRPMRHALSTSASPVTPQAPGPAPRSAALRASGTTHEGPQRRSGAEDQPPAPHDGAPPARPCARPAGAPPARRPARGAGR